MMASVPHTLALLEDLGAFMSRLDHSLSQFSHSAMRRVHLWDVSQLHLLEPFITFIADSENQALVRKVIAFILTLF
jgi:Ser/Thr protein kinase RdoA (MazF antagonist)